MTAHPLETTGLTLCATVSIGTTPAAAAPSDRQWAVETGGKVGLSPTIVNSTVYVGSEDGNLYALDAANGTERWRYETGATAADVVMTRRGRR